MIIDNLNVFSHDQDITITGPSDCLQIQPFAGKTCDHVNITLVITEPLEDGCALTVAVQESKDDDDYATLVTHVFPEPQSPGASLTLALPKNLKKPWVRLFYTVTGNSDTGRLFAAITRDHHAPYEPGQYVNAGQIRG